MTLKQFARICLGFITIALCTGCTTQSVEKDTVTVYTSFHAMYDFAKNVAGDAPVEVVNLVPAGVEPHDWEPTPKDLERLSQADLFVYNGNHMEHWVDKVLDALPESLTVVEAAAQLELEETEDAHDEHGYGEDPHVWLNPAYAIKEVEAICNGFVQADPENGETYRQNADRFIDEIRALDSQYKETLKQLPGKNIVTAHGAYGYLCHAYGIYQTAIEGILGDSDPTPAQMEKIMAFMKDNHIRHIFFDPNESGRSAGMIAKEAGAISLTLSAFECDSQNRGYIEVMTENLKNLEKALAGA